MNLVEFCNYCPNCPDAWEIYVKATRYLEQYERPACFISGGADSDVMLDIIYNADNDKKVRYVYFDTGLEMDATKRHIKYLEEKYGIKVETVRPKVPIPVAVKKHGVPVFNKQTSETIHSLQNIGFDFVTADYDINSSKYEKKWAISWFGNTRKDKRNNIDNIKYLQEYMLKYPPRFSISDHCCKDAKKNPSKDYCKEHNIDLKMTGVRKAEGGTRAMAYTSCFSEHTTNGTAEFRPLFWMKSAERKQYEEDTGLIHSDAYTVYGCKRTGCAGCPFSRNFEADLKMLEKYEPKLYKAANSIFKESYDYMRAFYKFREAKKKEKEQSR